MRALLFYLKNICKKVVIYLQLIEISFVYLYQRKQLKNRNYGNFNKSIFKRTKS